MAEKHIAVIHRDFIGWPRNQHVGDFVVHEGMLHQVTKLSDKGYFVKDVPLTDETRKLLTPELLKAIAEKETHPAPEAHKPEPVKPAPYKK